MSEGERVENVVEVVEVEMEVVVMRDEVVRDWLC